jgi:hypothetical protein
LKTNQPPGDGQEKERNMKIYAIARKIDGQMVAKNQHGVHFTSKVSEAFTYAEKWQAEDVLPRLDDRFDGHRLKIIEINVSD